MTLFELMLVLAILVVVTSLAVPLFEGSFSTVRLRRGTDQVVAVWSETRTHAIESGKIFQFRFRPKGNAYQVSPWTGGIELAPRDREDAIGSSERTKEELEFSNWRHNATLPENIVFADAESVSSDKLGQRTVTRLDEENTEGNTTKWSAPILFFPDGSTSAASLLIKNDREVFRRATLRALTGVARASALLSREEVDRFKTR